MTKDEALRLALEALEKISMGGDPRWADQAIACLRLVIDAENISSKPMAWEQFYPEMGKPKLVEVQDGECKYCTDGCPACDTRKLPEQEPVAWIWEKKDGYTFIETHSLDDEDMKNVGVKSIKPLYDKPQFIGLSEDEIVLISADCAASHQHTDIHFARAIETKLRSKNDRND
jgi:hypothetical protein